MPGSGAAFQQARIARLEAQRGHIERYIGTRLIYNAYHAEWHTDALHVQTVGPYGVREDAAERRLHPRHITQGRGDVIEPRHSELKPVVFRVSRVRLCKVFGVGPEQSVRPLPGNVGKVSESRVYLIIADEPELPRSLPGPYKKFVHDFWGKKCVHIVSPGLRRMEGMIFSLLPQAMKVSIPAAAAALAVFALELMPPLPRDDLPS